MNKPTYTTVPRSRLRIFAQGSLGGLALLAIATGAAAAPLADPGPVAPVARLINLQVTRVARGAYFRAMSMDGWTLTKTMRMDNSEVTAP